MRILIMWQSEYPWDVRIDKFVRTFVNLGHSVVVLANNRFHKSNEDEYLGAKIIRLQSYSIPHPFNKMWVKYASSIATKFSPDLIMVRDLPLYLIAKKVSINQRVPVWLDMAEDYPATFLDMERTLLDRIFFKNYLLGRVYERFAISSSDIISVVVDESYKRIIKLGADPSSTYVIANVPEMSFASLTLDLIKDEIKSLLNNKAHQFIMLYEGNTDKKRGLEIVLQALKFIKMQEPQKRLQFIIAGGQKEELNRLHRISKGLGVEDSLDCLGKLPYEYLPYVIDSADICIVPHLRTLHTITTVPNKLFDYLALGKPVIVSDIPPLKRIVEEKECGYVYRAGDPQDLAKKILLLMDSKSKRDIFSNNAKIAFTQEYNWQKEEEKISNILKTVAEGIVKA